MMQLEQHRCATNQVIHVYYTLYQLYQGFDSVITSVLTKAGVLHCRSTLMTGFYYRTSCFCDLLQVYKQNLELLMFYYTFTNCFSTFSCIKT